MKPKKPRNEDTSKVTSITELQDKAIEETLEAKCLSLAYQVRMLNEEIVRKDEEIVHLKSLLSKSVPIIGDGSPGKSVAIEISDEETIAQYQLEELKRHAMQRTLTLEEVKKYDLLVKNKRLAQGNSTVNADYVKLPNNLGKKELLKIATSKAGDNDDSN